MKSSNILSIALFAATAAAVPSAFDPVAQRISTTGDHQFVPPNFENGDQRGPCPGLNALANHGYLPHNGVATISQFVSATNQVFGLGNDVATAIAIVGAITAGDGVSWSIGGPPGLGNVAPGLLGPPQGISFSHNQYEGDASVTRPDLYAAGNDYKVDLAAFKQLDDTLPTSQFSTLVEHRYHRVMNSVQTNPYFFSGPFTAIIVSGGANSFVYRLLANHSAEYPDGYLSKETFRSFWSVSETNGQLSWTPGWDRIPDNWYRRSKSEEYDAERLNADLVTYFLAHPETVKVGGNTGKVNTFTGVDLTNATGGVYNAADLAKGNNAACLGYQAATFIFPDILSKIWKDITSPMAQLTQAIAPITSKLGCPQLQQFDEQALRSYPGYSQNYNYYKGL